ncbi:unnamed protein product [Linum trigynum]|uniref:Uncharacterized protein n=1 Tax=Linum trigynum TaxID=586398 RepID=A0AAV2EJ23_9ROSI
MAAPTIDGAGSEARETLKAFHHRALEAEDRLSRLEAALASKADGEDSELLKTISKLQSKLEDVTAELASERQKAQKLAVENGKLQYRVTHLVRSIRESD